MIKYDNHDSELQETLSDPARSSFIIMDEKDALDPFSCDEQSPFLSILQSFNSPSLLTVGDGRFGNDAHYFLEHGISAHCSDFSDKLLSKASSSRFVDIYSGQNAEHLTFNHEFLILSL